MNSDPEKFETLRKLMALKRHEQPPPEYLHQLSDRIITRIEHGEGRLTLWDKLSARLSLRPSVAYAFGMTVCGTLVLSGVYMIKQGMTQAADSSPEAALRGPAPADIFASQFKSTPPLLHVANWLGNTNPTTETQSELSFFSPSHAVIPVSYESGN